MPTQVNLRPETPDYKNPFIHWLSNNGKYVLLGFNAILFGLYLYRFQLDRKNILIKESVVELNSEIKELEPAKENYSSTQDVAFKIDTESEKDIDPIFIMDFLSAATPSGIRIESVTAENSNLEFNAVSRDPSEFTTLLGIMLDEPRFTSVILDSSNYNEKEDSFNFTLQVGYN